MTIEFANSFSFILSILTIFGMVGIVVFVVALFHQKKQWSRKLIYFVGKNSLALTFTVALAGTIGSLIYSNIIGYAPCELCWIQRIFLYSQVVILATALWIKDKGVIPYSIVLSICGALVALYQVYTTQLGGLSFTQCTALEGACSKLFVNEWGFVTIPFMALVAFLLMFFIMVNGKIHHKTSTHHHTS
ncbi:MAG: disulfide bond formation protein B [Parcubacteria group bacterium]|nr:disulfide bond formation protein B [Parcubacteria group bacterium]